MKKTLTLALAAGFLALSANAFALRIAQVDVKKVFEKYSGTQTAKDKLKKEVDELLYNLEEEMLARQLETVMTDLGHAERNNEIEDTIILLNKTRDITQRLNTIKNSRHSKS